MKDTNSDETTFGTSTALGRRPIRFFGVRTHNLKNVDVAIPWNKTTAITGKSGGGKSSLAFDTIFAESQRQFVETLSIASRRVLNRLERPDIDGVSGLPPTVAISQRPVEPNPRSTLATVSEIYDYLRLLFARVAVARCYSCGRPIQRQTPEEIQETIQSLPPNTRFMILAPIVRDKLGAHVETIARLIRANFVRARIDGVLLELSQAPKLDPLRPHTIEIVVDRLILREGVESRLAEAIKSALQEGEGYLVCMYEKERSVTETGATRSLWKDLHFSQLYSCPKCGVGYAEFEPRTFSFNSRYGACPRCAGCGRFETFSSDALLPDRSLALEGGALALGKGLGAKTQRRLSHFLNDFKRFEPDAYEKPIAEWSEKTLDFFLYGAPRDDAREEAFLNNPNVFDVDGQPRDAGRSEEEASEPDPLAPARPFREPILEENADDRFKFLGLIETLEQALDEAKSKRERDYLNSFRAVVTCNVCNGARLRREARFATVADKRINDITALSVKDAIPWFKSLEFSDFDARIAKPIIKRILARLETMAKLRLEYLTLDRRTDTLSGGELQRARLAAALGNGLAGVCYVLDEPTVGLHPRDVERLLESFETLKSRDATVVVVEHNMRVARQADYIIDVGPGAGVNGGEIIATGTPDELARNPKTSTGRALAELESPAPARKRRKMVKTRSLTLEGVRTHNLKNVDVSIPLGLFVCVTGVSGSGKSSLVSDTLVPALRKRLRSTADPVALDGDFDDVFDSFRGASRIEKLVEVDQSPIGRSPRSVPATYSGVFDEIRKLFANCREAKTQGYKAGRFSFNIAGGRCERCQGLGAIKIESPYLQEVYSICPECEGKRFSREILDVRYRGKSIAETLEMTFDEAADFFANHATLARYLKSFQDVGLGYLALGQSASSLSGGEAQRVKLATELSRAEAGATLYVLDEPTAGLHPTDVEALLDVLQKLVDAGNTVVVVEHSTQVMAAADWIIDLGPEGGDAGGRILAAGTPEEVAAIEGVATARFLRETLYGVNNAR